MSKKYPLEGRAQGKTASPEAATAADCTEKLKIFKIIRKIFPDVYPTSTFILKTFLSRDFTLED